MRSFGAFRKCIALGAPITWPKWNWGNFLKSYYLFIGIWGLDFKVYNTIDLDILSDYLLLNWRTKKYCKHLRLLKVYFDHIAIM